jgi:hypothetical protein
LAASPEQLRKVWELFQRDVTATLNPALDCAKGFRPTQHVLTYGYVGLFWASHINAPADKRLYFRGGGLWQQLCTQRHNDESTVRHRPDKLQLRFGKGYPEFPPPPDRLLGWKAARGEQPLELCRGEGADDFPVVSVEPPSGRLVSGHGWRPVLWGT